MPYVQGICPTVGRTDWGVEIGMRKQKFRFFGHQSLVRSFNRHPRRSNFFAQPDILSKILDHGTPLEYCICLSQGFSKWSISTPKARWNCLRGSMLFQGSIGGHSHTRGQLHLIFYKQIYNDVLAKQKINHACHYMFLF